MPNVMQGNQGGQLEQTARAGAPSQMDLHCRPRKQNEEKGWGWTQPQRRGYTQESRQSSAGARMVHGWRSPRQPAAPRPHDSASVRQEQAGRAPEVHTAASRMPGKDTPGALGSDDHRTPGQVRQCSPVPQQPGGWAGGSCSRQLSEAPSLKIKRRKGWGRGRGSSRPGFNPWCQENRKHHTLEPDMEN